MQGVERRDCEFYETPLGIIKSTVLSEKHGVITEDRIVRIDCLMENGEWWIDQIHRSTDQE